MNKTHPKFRISKWFHSVNHHSFILNLVIGFIYMSCLQFAVSSSEVSDSLKMGGSIGISVLLISFYRAGRLLAAYSHLKAHSLLNINFLKLAHLFSAMSLIVLGLFTLTGRLIWIFSAMLFAGFASSSGSIQMQESLTENHRMEQKRYFSTSTTLGWSFGVLLVSVVTQIGLFFPTWIALVLITVFQLYTQSPCYSKLRSSPTLAAITITYSKTFLLILTGSVFSTLFSTFFNATIVPKIKLELGLGDFHLSLELLFLLIGSGLTLILNIDQFLSKISKSTLDTWIMIKYLFLAAFILSLFSESFFYFSLLLVAVGMLSNEDSALQYQLISDSIPESTRKSAHAWIDILSVMASALFGGLLTMGLPISSTATLLLILLLGWSTGSYIFNNTLKIRKHS